MIPTRNTILFYAQLLVIATMPFHLLASSYAIGILLLIFLYSIVTSSVYRSEIWLSFLSNKIAQVICLMFLAYLSSAILHQIIEPKELFNFTPIEQKLSFLVFPFLFANIKRYGDKKIQKFFYVYIVAVVISTIIALASGLYYTIISGSSQFYDSEKQVVFNNFMYHRLGSYVGMHAVYYAEYVLLAFIMWVCYSYYHFISWSMRMRSIAISLSVYLIGVMFLLKSAAILIILLFIVTLFTGYYLYKDKNSISKPVKILIAVLSIFIVVILADRAVSKIGSKANFLTYDLSQPGGGEWNGVNLRLAKWHVAMLAIKDNWLIGVGPGNTTATLDSYYKNTGFTYAHQLHYNPHNQLLQTFLTLGILGVLVLLVVYSLLIWHSLTKKDLVMFLFVVSFLMFSMSESTLAVNKGIVFFSIFLCFFSYLPKKSSYYLNAP